MKRIALTLLICVSSFFAPDLAVAQDRTYDCIIKTSCDANGCTAIGLEANIALSSNDTRLHMTGATGSKFYNRVLPPREDGLVRFEGTGTAENTHITWPTVPSTVLTFELYLRELQVGYLVHCPEAVLQ